MASVALKKGPIETRYDKLRSDREQYVEVARRCAELTIPTLFPADASDGRETSHSNAGREFVTPWQSMGSRGVNNLASKLVLALFPPNQPFFRFVMADRAKTELSQGDQKIKEEVEGALSKIERGVMKAIEASPLRTVLFEAERHLLVTGNYLLYLAPKNTVKGFRLDRYVCRRDPMGTPLETIVVESLDIKSVPENVRKIVEMRNGGAVMAELDKMETPVHIYTKIELKKNRYWIEQEVLGVTVPGSAGSYPKDKCPWLPLRFRRVEGEHYGRGLVEEYAGDLKSLEALSQSIVEASAAMARLLFLVKPGSSTKVRDLERLPNCGIGQGNAEDVTVLQAQKAAELRVASETAGKIQDSLAFAFLLNTAIQRPGERVTAEEIRFMAGELEDTLGGVYSIQSQELQLPVVKRYQFQLEREGEIPPLPEQAVSVTIVAGLEAIGRGHDNARFRGFIEDLGLLGKVAPGSINGVDWLPFIQRLATSRGIDVDGLFKSPEQMQAETAAAEQGSMRAMVMPEIAKAGGNVATEITKGAMKNVQQQQQPQS